MSVKNKIELEFAGLTLPVVQDEEGRDVVPLKPISDVFGLKWETQRTKVRGPYLSRRLGVVTPLMGGGVQELEMVCIRVDRVAAFLNQINPERVRANGNATGADFLEEKHAEWDDLIHEYETRKGGMLENAGRGKAVNLRLYLAVLREKRATSDERDRVALSKHAEALSQQAGIPYQPELPAV